MKVLVLVSRKSPIYISVGIASDKGLHILCLRRSSFQISLLLYHTKHFDVPKPSVDRA